MSAAFWKLAAEENAGHPAFHTTADEVPRQRALEQTRELAGAQGTADSDPQEHHTVTTMPDGRYSQYRARM